MEQDTAGQERFHNLAMSYCRGTDAYVMVYNVENAQSLADLQHWWMPRVRQRFDPPHIPPIVLGTRPAPFLPHHHRHHFLFDANGVDGVSSGCRERGRAAA